ncbi:MAG TPA: hypothetical protein VGD91_24185 [Trebonia sp.]
MTGSRSNMGHQRSRAMSGSPGRTLPVAHANAASSSSGVPPFFPPAFGRGDPDTATWLTRPPPRSGCWTKWQPGPT